MSSFDRQNEMQRKSDVQISPPWANEPDIPFSSNGLRLSGWEWIGAAIIISALLSLAPAIWRYIEKFEPATDYRLPSELSNDYWLYSRYARWVCSHYETLVIGDSVIWGHYVSENNTLSHHLNEIAGRDRFANMGVDGIHPAAMEGLLKYYGRAISGKNVILHLNPLWMSSDKHDLQIDKEFRFNHPKLVPQFTPKIPCYKVPYSKRILNVAERYIPFLSWSSHLKISCFENMDLPGWTMEHPYDNPLRAITLNLSVPEGRDYAEHISWTQKNIPKQDMPFVQLDTSLQWKFFRRSIEILKARGNRVFVLVGPFNEHMLKGKSIDTYQKMKNEIETWLLQQNVPYYMAPPLPSEFYCDASHPLSEGYSMLAKEIYENEPFRSGILYSGRDSASSNKAKYFTFIAQKLAAMEKIIDVGHTGRSITPKPGRSLRTSLPCSTATPTNGSLEISR